VSQGGGGVRAASARPPPPRARAPGMAKRMHGATAAGAWTEIVAKIQRAAADAGFNLHEAGRRGLREASFGPAQAAMRTFGAEPSAIRVAPRGAEREEDEQEK
ncbi:unnamed protein product, partial [Prorocentrum cordatum]